MPGNKGYASMDKTKKVKSTLRGEVITNMASKDPDGAQGFWTSIQQVADPWKFMEKDLHPKAGEGEFSEGKS